MSQGKDKWSLQHFLQELERRRVHRVAVAYLAGGWMLLEASDLIFQRLEFA